VPIKIAQPHDTKTALTFSDPGIVEFFGDELTETIGDGIDMLFCNKAEAQSFTQKESIDDAIEVIKTFSKEFAITMGADGAVIYDGKSLIEIAANPVKAVDTNGAGDMFAGAFLYGMTHGYSYEEAGNLASLGASSVVSQFGPRLSLDEYKELAKEEY
jgi:sugar/nucleoside kinase (ribokinase family)